MSKDIDDKPIFSDDSTDLKDTCNTCESLRVPARLEPCLSCWGYDKWIPKKK